MNTLKFFSLLLVASMTIVACTPQASVNTNASANVNADAMMEGDNMEKDDSMEKDSMMEGDNMEKEGAMMDKEGDSMDKDGGVMVDVDADVMVGEMVTVELDGFNFGYSKDEIRVKQGDKVRIVLTSTDGFHDWVVDEFDAATEQIRTGDTTEVIFTADKKGSFEYYCSVGSHRAQGMVGTLIVELLFS